MNKTCKHEPDFTNASADCCEEDCCDLSVSCRHCGIDGYAYIIADRLVRWNWLDD